MESKNVFNGLKWASIELVFDAFMKVGLKFLLANLLLPEAFGLVAMCIVFIAISQSVSELGFRAALIQKKKDSDAERLYNTAFWSNLAVGILIFAVVYFLVSPAAASFYNEEILKQLIPLLSINVLIAPFMMIPTVVLTRQLNFKFFAKAYNLGTLVSGVIAITMAYMGYGVWALVVNQMLAVIFPLPLLLFKVKWKPKFFWDRNEFKELLGFGVYSTGTSIMRSAMTKTDYLIIGKLLGASLVGAYSIAFLLTDNLTNFLVRVINKVMYPVFSQNQDSNSRLQKFFLTIIKVNAISVYPLMGFLICFASLVINEFFGEEWTEAIVPLRFLAAAMILQLFVNGFDALLRAKGKPKKELKIFASLGFLVLIPCLIVGTTYFGLLGASIAVCINAVVTVTVALFVLKKEIELKPLQPFSAILGPLAAMIIAALLTLGTDQFLSLNNVYVLGIEFALIYGLMVLLLERKFIRGLLQIVKKQRKN